MIDSCKDCKSICCKTGPGPFEELEPEDYLDNFGTTDSYNTKCSALDKDDKCELWGTSDFPLECRTYVCQNRSFSKEELDTLENIEEADCPNCEAEYLVNEYSEEDDVTVQRCEACGFKTAWASVVIDQGDKIEEDEG